MSLVGLVLVTALALSAVFAPQLAPHDPARQRLMDRRAKPGGAYILGADNFGRDVLSRVLYGGRVTLLVGAASVGLGFALGLGIGMISGYFGGRIDELLMRSMDVLLAFPYLLLAIVIVTALGPGVVNTTIAIGIWATPSFARLVRSGVLSVKTREYVEAARAIGVSTSRLLFRHMLPNFISPVVVFATLFMARAVLMEASLSFLGLGAQPPTPSWGGMVSEGRSYLLNAPHIAVVPGVAIALAVLGFNLLGDGLRDALDSKTDY